jgi:WD40 repeat protein
MQMGCTFVQGDIPITVSLSGKILILPLSSSTSSPSSTSTLKSLTGHQSPISCMTINHTNGIMYTGDLDGVICMWDIRTGTSITNVQKQQKKEEDSVTTTSSSNSNVDMNTSIDSMSSTVNESFDETLLNKVHKSAITGLVSVSMNNSNGNSNGNSNDNDDNDRTTLLSIGWDDKIRLTHTSITKSSIQLASQPN